VEANFVLRVETLHDGHAGEFDIVSPYSLLPTVAAHRVSPPAAAMASAESFSELLAGAAPGLVVRRYSGSVGGGARLELRGPDALLVGRQPLLVVDGVRALSEETTLLMDLGGMDVSGYDDLDPDLVESVEVLPGPAAAARYGPAGTNGALVVRTRPGALDGPRWRGFASAGARDDPGGYPASFAQVGRTPGGARVAYCPLYQQDAGTCTAVADSLRSVNPLEQSSPFRTGSRLAAGVSANGRAAGFTYGGSVHLGRASGVLDVNDEARTGVRVSLATAPISPLPFDLWVTAGHERRNQHLPFEGGSGVIAAGLLADPTMPTLTLPSATYENAHDVRRTTAGVEAVFHGTDWLSLSGRFGIDHLARDGTSSQNVDSFRRTTRADRQLRTGAVEATAVAGWGQASAETTLGAERVSEHTDLFSRVDGGGGSAEERARVRVHTLGVSLRQSVLWGELGRVEALVRRDEPESGDPLWAASAAAAWGVGKHLALPGWLRGTTLRAAWGRVERTQGAAPGVDSRELGLANFPGPPPPQLAEELEAGVDLETADGRHRVSLTGYRRDDANVLFLVQGGPGPILRDGTGVRNTGAELSARAGVLRTPRAKWDVEVLGWVNRNRVTGDAEANPLIFAGGRQRVQRGLPLGAYFAVPLVGFQDRNGNGILGLDEVELGDTAVYLGSPTPTRTAALASTLRLGDRLSLSVRVEHQGGAKLMNLARLVRCGVILRCRELVDPATPLAEQAEAVALLLDADGPAVESADFTRLREVAVTIAAPRAWASRLGAAGVELTIAGRNLATWTPYGGLDPEVDTNPRFLLRAWEYASQPLPRTVTTRLEVAF
ncbi:MAG TPA: TonB-dependent receptor plug domain-containing protein, partial [Longimicrobiaceae bacterium]|nr:TonB-dependent receptor plug domain-containing protein [Longimicrobiaceae bacterium]